jgi:hypothetical protein
MLVLICSLQEYVSQIFKDLPHHNQVPKRLSFLIKYLFDAGSRYLVIWMFFIGDAYTSDTLPGTS